MARHKCKNSRHHRSDLFARAFAETIGRAKEDIPEVIHQCTRRGSRLCSNGDGSKPKRTVVFVTHSIPEAVFLSSRIVVMSPRPGRIVEVIESTLPAERQLDIRDTPEFAALAHRVRLALADGHG